MGERDLKARDGIRKGRRHLAGLMATVIAVAGLTLGVTATPEPAAAAPTGCNYADSSANNGQYASTICWFDFSNFNQTLARTTDGQQMQVGLDGGLTAKFTVKLTDLPGAFPMSLELRQTPLEPRFAFGTDAYRGVLGKNTLYSLSAPAGLKGAQIAFSNIQVVDSLGSPVAGYTFVAADTEDNVRNESFAWSSDKKLREIERLAPNGGWGCKNPVGLGTMNVSCAGTGNGGTTEAGGKSTALLVAADSPTSFATQWRTAARSGIAIGIQTAKLTVIKAVSGRIAPADSFQVTATNSSGTVVGQGTTGAANTATTGALIVAPGGTYTVSEGVEPGSPTNLANYTATWSCVNAVTASTTVLPVGPGLTQSLVPAAGDDITCTVTNAAKGTGLSLQKVAAPPTDVNANGITDAGDTIAYSFTVTNTGQTDVETVAINDPKAGEVSCPTGTVTPTNSVNCSTIAPYVITTADVTAGAVNNTATATAHPAGSPAVITSDPSSTSTPTEAPAPALALVKSADPSAAAAYVAGQLITYSFVVRNVGNVPLQNLAIDDGDFSGTGTLSALSCPPGFGALLPNEQAICTATYTLTQADVNAGTLNNSASVTGDPVGGPGPITSPESQTSVPIDPATSVSLTKRVTPTVATAPGTVISYEFDVTNTGNVSLTGAEVTETAFSGTGTPPAPTCPSGAFIPGETVTCTASYTLTQADVNSGSVSNTATAAAVAPSGPDPVAAPSSATVTTPATGSLALVKTAQVSGTAIAGDVVTYSFAVTNSGNVTVGDLSIDETAFSGTGALGAVACVETTLNAGDSTTCTASYTLTQADVDAGSVTNTAVATSQRPGTTTDVTSLPDLAVVDTASTASISLQKSVTPTALTSAGSPVAYSFLIRNTGTVTLANPTVTETAFSGSGVAPDVSCPPTALAPNETVTCTASYTATQADVDAGTITNTATSTATAPVGITAPVSDPSTATVTIAPGPALTVVKSASPNESEGFVVGQVITYSFVVTNTGNTMLADVEVIDGQFTGSGVLPAPICPTAAASLAPGAQVTCESQYTLTQDDIDAGFVTNAATATADPPGPTQPPMSPVSRVTIPELAAPAIALVKATDTETVDRVGQDVEYTFTVTNTGNTTLTALAIVEGSFSGVGKLSAPDCPAGGDTLLPGEITVCTAIYSVQSADLTGKPLVNTATVTATGAGLPIESDPSTARVDDVLKLPTGEMASTGLPVPWGLVAAALGLLLAGGLVLVLRAARQRDRRG